MVENEKITSEKTDQKIPDYMELLVVNMDKVLFEGRIKSFIAPGPYINVAILPGHTPLYTKLITGKLIINTEKGAQEIEIEEGLAKIGPNKVVILVGFKSDKDAPVAKK